MTTNRGRARLGVLVPFTNSNLEPDLALMAPNGISLHVTRMGGYDEDEIPDDAQMAGLGASDLSEPLHLLQGVKPDVVLYGCTSATLTHGVSFDQTLAQNIKAKSGAKTVTAAGALVAALEELGAKRIGFASPYVPAINDLAIGFLSDSGFETIKRSEVTETLDNTGQGALTPTDVFALGAKADHTEADAIVLSCTDMRSVETVDELEAKLGKPVICSNQAMMFQALRMLEIPDSLSGYGSLLERSRI